MIPLRTTRPPTRPAPTTPAGEILELLLACHERIRRFGDAAVMIATLPVVAPAEVREAAQAIHRYFTIALPLHTLDEDVSILARLQPDANRAMRNALARMHQEHGSIATARDALVPLWEALIQDPYRLRELPLRAPSEALRTLTETHLCHEEEHIFPAIKRLSEDSAVRILSEMRARRSPTVRTGTDALSSS